MTAYRGIINIICTRKKGGCLRNLGSDVQPGCMDCPEAATQILDLDDKVIYEYRPARRSFSGGGSPKERTGKRKN